MKSKTIFVLLSLSLVTASNEGDSCTKNGLQGVCTYLKKCQNAIRDLKLRRPPQICAFTPGDPIICCVEDAANDSSTKKVPQILFENRFGDTNTTQKPDTVTVKSTYGTVVITTREPDAVTTVTFNYDSILDNDTVVTTTQEPDQTTVASMCDPIPNNGTVVKTGQKAWDKCIEYQERLVFPCEENIVADGTLVRKEKCNRKPDGLIIGGEEAYVGEFPHMVHLGYGDPVSWMCGGILISERFVLTAGHCTFSKERGPVTKIKIGLLRRSDVGDERNIYNVANITKHPLYMPPKVYNDIALLESDRQMHLDRFAVPGCLHDGAPVNDSSATVTGWGTTLYKQKSDAEILQKVSLAKFSTGECIRKLKNYRTRNFHHGFNVTTQSCFGDRSVSKDSCQGDSGGPLQIKHPQLKCMYSVLGVTSWGRWCGRPGEPGVYTRASHFLPWIESIVWPG